MYSLPKEYSQKIKAIQHMPPPTDKKGIERSIGTVNYLAKFIPNMSTITIPIRDVLKKDVPFHWDSAQNNAFAKIKDTLSSAPVLAFYDVNKPVVISCDASQSGLGALLLQDGKPIAYASRALSSAETRYAQIEKELLAVVFSFTKFHQYVYSKDVIVESDHKPLEAIMKKALAAAPPRLQRMLLQLQKYSFTLHYKPGKEMVLADTLSRAYIDKCVTTQSTLEEDLDCMVHMVLSNAPFSDAKLEEVRKATAEDTTMRILQETLHDGWPDKLSEAHSSIKLFWTYRDELSEANGLILKVEKIVIKM